MWLPKNPFTLTLLSKVPPCTNILVQLSFFPLHLNISKPTAQAYTLTFSSIPQLSPLILQVSLHNKPDIDIDYGFVHIHLTLLLLYHYDSIIDISVWLSIAISANLYHINMIILLLYQYISILVYQYISNFNITPLLPYMRLSKCSALFVGHSVVKILALLFEFDDTPNPGSKNRLDPRSWMVYFVCHGGLLFSWQKSVL